MTPTQMTNQDPCAETTSSALATLFLQKRDIEARIATHKHEERGLVIRRILQTMADHGLTTVDLARGKMTLKAPSEATKARRLVAPKFRHPTTGETWSGRGLKPTWMTKHMNEGHSLESTRIA